MITTADRTSARRGSRLTSRTSATATIAVSALREWMSELGHRAKVAVSALGKYKTIMQMVGLSILLYRHELLGLPMYRVGLWLTALAALLTLVSMVIYLRAALPYLRTKS